MTDTFYWFDSVNEELNGPFSAMETAQRHAEINAGPNRGATIVKVVCESETKMQLVWKPL